MTSFLGRPRQNHRYSQHAAAVAEEAVPDDEVPVVAVAAELPAVGSASLRPDPVSHPPSSTGDGAAAAAVAA